MEKINCCYLTILCFTFSCIFIVQAGQVISAYNLITPEQFPLSQSYSGEHSLNFPIPNNYYSNAIEEREVLAHPKAVETSFQESHIPKELKKSDKFYENPYVASALARESLNFNKESVIYDRPSEKIERQEIIKLINSLYRVHHEKK